MHETQAGNTRRTQREFGRLPNSLPYQEPSPLSSRGVCTCTQKDRTTGGAGVVVAVAETVTVAASPVDPQTLSLVPGIG